MNRTVVVNIIRFVVLIILQGILLKRIEFSDSYYQHIHIIIYPIFILLLPLKTPTSLAVFLGFIAGLTVDMFYYAIGVHAAAATFLGFIRQSVLAIIQPRGGYNMLYSPTRRRMGNTFYFRYLGIMLFIFLFFYFSVEAFTFVYIDHIVLNTIFSFVASMLFASFYTVIFDPIE